MRRLLMWARLDLSLSRYPIRQVLTGKSFFCSSKFWSSPISVNQKVPESCTRWVGQRWLIAFISWKRFISVAQYQSLMYWGGFEIFNLIFFFFFINPFVLDNARFNGFARWVIPIGACPYHTPMSECFETLKCFCWNLLRTISQRPRSPR